MSNTPILYRALLKKKGGFNKALKSIFSETKIK